MTEQTPPSTLPADVLARLDAGTGTPQEATQRLAEMKAAYDAAQAGPAPSAEPKTASEAYARMRQLERDGEWRARVLSGNAEARHEFDNLTKLIGSDDVDRAMNGAIPLAHEYQTRGPSQAGIREMASTVADWRDKGVVTTAEDELLAEHFLRDGKYDRAEVELARQVRAELISQPGFLERLKARDPFTVQMFERTGWVLTAGADPTLPNNEKAVRLLQDRWARRYQNGRLT